MSDSDEIWAEFDAVLARAKTESPWLNAGSALATYRPDYETLASLLAVPLRRGARHQTGMPAKAIDVWLASELRRAGFGENEVWPRPAAPRVLPREVALLLDGLPASLRTQVTERIRDGKVRRVGSVDARVLGKAYEKQVDVVVAQWARGPEVLVSTKRMSSSLSNNAFNRVEESYGDAHNLRGRYPLAAIGYVLLLRSTALKRDPAPAERLLDLIEKLGADDQGYDATAVIVASWDGTDDLIDPDSQVTIESAAVPDALGIDQFLKRMVGAVLERTPVDLHVLARERFSGRGLAVSEE